MTRKGSLAPSEDAEPADARSDNGVEHVTILVGGQLFGIPIARVHDVFVTGEMTRVPLAPPEVAGLLNLRGRVITAVDLRTRLGVPAPAGPASAGPVSAGTASAGRMAVGIELGSEHYGLLVDEVGEVLRLGPDSRHDSPAHLAGRWAELSTGIHRLADRLLVVLDVDRVLSLPQAAAAA